MQTFVISLKRTPERHEQFVHNNSGIPGIVRVDAVDGNTLSLDQLKKQNLIDGELEYTKGAIGNALSHKQLWERCIAEKAAITICEDDAYLHHDFTAATERQLQLLGGDWDIVLWGWNFNTVFLARPEPNLSHCHIIFNQSEMRANKSAYLKAEHHPTMLRLQAALGTVCYSISPRGAKRLLEYCFPLTQFALLVPEVKFNLVISALDAVMCSQYRDIRAWACFPPLAVTDNDEASSTVQTDRS